MTMPLSRSPIHGTSLPNLQPHAWCVGIAVCARCNRQARQQLGREQEQERRGKDLVAKEQEQEREGGQNRLLAQQSKCGGQLW